jgi:cyclophilin family peptidyl-prolyl cis-trans isomerase/HEAT repeat protein
VPHAGVLLVVFALLDGPQTVRAIEQNPARTNTLAAEDRRIALPDGVHSPAIDALRAQQAEDVRAVLKLTRSTDAEAQARAVRALGRYERRELTGELLLLLSNGPRAEVVQALAQSLRGDPLPLDTTGEQVRTVFDALVMAANRPLAERDGATLGTIVRAIGRLPYVSADQVRAADSFLTRAFVRVDADPALGRVTGDLTAASESLARLHGRTATLSDDLVTWLRRIVTTLRHDMPARVSAMLALIAARGLDAETLRVAAAARDAKDLRRLAAISIGGAGSPLPATERTETLIALLDDSSPQVRIEAVRAWARQESANGCARIVERLKDDSLHVTLVATELLGDACRGDVSVTDRIVAAAKTPPAADWHRESQALVALARRAPERVTIPLLAHIAHPVWQVRMYAARAASIAGDLSVLERLASDPEDNVREATLAALRRIKQAEAEPHLVAALARHDYQLLRTAANELKGMPATPVIAGALADALKRITADGRETSRDARLAILERLRELGNENQASAVVPLLRDFDIPVAMAAAATLEGWTGKAHDIDPQLLPRPPLPTSEELAIAEGGSREIEMSFNSGRKVKIVLLPKIAPLTSVRFLRLVTAGYYNGRTFHRVVPNFVVQGGSPGANEYMGDGPFTRDEIDAVSHTRGTVGLSTRGRDTGDMQFFINLVDNPRLDYQYTVFGRIADEDLERIETIIEGEEIVRIEIKKKDDEKR